MSIVPPAHGPWRDPSTGEPFVQFARTAHGDYEVTIRPGADPVDIARVLGAIPPDAVFTESFGDVVTTLVFRTVQGASVPTRPAPGAGFDRIAALIPTGPIEREPRGWVPFEDRRRILVHPLDGVELGEHDRHMIDWLLLGDAPSIVTFASLIRRARRAEAAALCRAE